MSRDTFEVMSNLPETGPEKVELDLDLQLLPAWAQKPPAENKYAKYEGGGEEKSGRRRSGPGPGPTDRRRERPPIRKDRPQGGNRDSRLPQQSARPFRDDRRERPEPRIELNVSFVPDEKGAESLARQIRLTGRAYPLFDVAILVLRKPDRYLVRFDVYKSSDGKILQPLFVCELDESLWLSEADAIDYVLSKHFATFYQSERVQTEPPKGTYTFVAQCGMSGTILGPPNYHDYQNKLRRLHSDRFSNMPFEMFKSRIKIVRDEAVVKKWVEEQSWKIEYNCLNVPESLKLGSREEVEKHFREVHLANVIKSVESHTLTGTAAQALPDRALQNLVRRSLDYQLRFPLRVVNILSQQFARHGLQFFKVNKTVTHVTVARPHYLDVEATPVSEGIKRIVDFINANPKGNRRKLLESLAPGTPIAPSGIKDGASQEEATAPTPEAAAIISDLHWLIHQGHVIEFSNGILETAKRPPPQPPRPAKIETPADSAAKPAAKVDAPVPSDTAESVPCESERGTDMTTQGTGELTESAEPHQEPPDPAAPTVISDSIANAGLNAPDSSESPRPEKPVGETPN